MIGKLIGATVGAKTASSVSGGIGGAGGALLGAGAMVLVSGVSASMIKRLSPLGIIAAAAGGYAMKRYMDKREKRRPEPKSSAT